MDLDEECPSSSTGSRRSFGDLNVTGVSSSCGEETAETGVVLSMRLVADWVSTGSKNIVVVRRQILMKVYATIC